jgi:hypothetical protein
VTGLVPVDAELIGWKKNISVMYEGSREFGQSQLRKGRGSRACLEPMGIENLRSIKKFSITIRWGEGFCMHFWYFMS